MIPRKATFRSTAGSSLCARLAEQRLGVTSREMVTKTLLTILVILILASGVARQDTSSPWRKSSHGLRDTEKCATETPRHRESLGFLRVSVPLWPRTPCLAGRVQLSLRPTSPPIYVTLWFD